MPPSCSSSTPTTRRSCGAIAKTRRRHPHASAATLLEAIAAERASLAALRDRADVLWDTTNFTQAVLKDHIHATFVSGDTRHTRTTVIAFGFKYGVPLDADWTFDVRFLPNPHYQLDLRPLNGNDAGVAAYLEQSEDLQPFLERLFALVDFVVPRARAEGKSQLTFAVGCTADATVRYTLRAGWPSISSRSANRRRPLKNGICADETPDRFRALVRARARRQTLAVRGRVRRGALRQRRIPLADRRGARTSESTSSSTGWSATSFRRRSLVRLSRARRDPRRARIWRWLNSIVTAVRPYGTDRMIDALLDTRLKRGYKIVTIGGGTGLATLLRGLKKHTSNLSAVVTVSDDGGSSGRLQKELGVLPPGDIRNCLVALADDEALVTDLFRYRFTEGEGLTGHSFGNLFLAAMTGITGNFDDAIKVSSRVLNIKGRVLPATLAVSQLCARLSDGSLIEGESNISKSTAAIDHVFLDPPHAEPLQEVIAAIRDADAIVLGPGSLYTSIMPNCSSNASLKKSKPRTR